jgi:hypothetical protein
MFRSWLSPSTILWISGHLTLLLLGFLIMGSTALQEWWGKPLAEGVGSSLVATGITGAVLFLYVRTSDTLLQRMDAFTRAGLINVYSGRAVLIKEEYDQRLQRARHIDLIGYGLGNFRQEYAAHFAEWSRRANVRILLLDPDFPSNNHSLADQRDREEGHPEHRTRHDIDKLIEVISQDKNINRERFQVRWMRVIPAINLLRIDDELFWGPYLMNQQSRNTPTLLVQRGGFLYSSFTDHFEAIWREAPTVFDG